VANAFRCGALHLRTLGAHPAGALVPRGTAAAVGIAGSSIERGGQSLALPRVQVTDVFGAGVFVVAFCVKLAAVGVGYADTFADDTHVILGTAVAIGAGQAVQ